MSSQSQHNLRVIYKNQIELKLKSLVTTKKLAIVANNLIILSL